MAWLPMSLWKKRRKYKSTAFQFKSKWNEKIRQIERAERETKETERGRKEDRAQGREREIVSLG